MPSRALILDDEHPARDTVCRIAESEGFTPVSARSLQEARERLGAGPVDLAFLDLQLPDGDGFELLPDLSTGAGTEVVFMTGHGTVDRAVRAFKGGAADFLEKPLSLTELRAIFRRVRCAREGDDASGAAAASPMDGTREEAQRFGVGSSIRQVEKELIFATLAYTRGNKPAAARTLGISLKTLYNRLNSYAVER